eukprot:349892-Chlamydomonas_euryale.AAC.2
MVSELRAPVDPCPPWAPAQPALPERPAPVPLAPASCGPAPDLGPAPARGPACTPPVATAAQVRSTNALPEPEPPFGTTPVSALFSAGTWV